MSRLIPLALVLTALAAGQARAAEHPLLEERGPGANRDPDSIEEIPWLEAKTGLPSYPSDGDLIEFRVDRAANPFRYFLDRTSLSRGEDGLMRYSLVIRSRSGASNTSFEAMKCDSSEYKVFAYGDGRGKFRPQVNAEWKPIQESLYNGVRKDLWAFYLCDGHIGRLPIKVEEAVRMGGFRLESNAYW